MSSTKVGKVVKLFVSTSEGRIEKKEIALDEKGVLEDKYYDTNANRSVLITSLYSYILASENFIDVKYGQLGENLLIDYNPYHLTSASRLRIGDVILQISQNCTLCKSLTKVDSKLPKLLKDDRGIFAQVVQSGTIKISDNIYLLNDDNSEIKY